MRRSILRAFLVSVSLIVAITTSALATPLVVFTELSSTQLTATADGSNFGTINNLGPDSWEWIPPDLPSDLSGFRMHDSSTYWQEPEDLTKGNWFGFTPNGFMVISDFDFSGFANPSVPDGSILTDHLEVLSATAGSVAAYDVQFYDKGDVSVPEPSTLLLVGSGLVGLCMRGIKKFKRI
jgi:hypothetical protein